MSFGLRTWSGAGAAELDTDNFTYQVIHNQLYQLALGQVLTIPIAGFNPATCAAAILPTLPSSGDIMSNALPYESVSVGVVTIRSKHPSEPQPEVGSTMQFRLLVMRYAN
jgi:hypothetical protein